MTIPTFIRHYARLADRIEELSGKGPFNLRREMMQRNIALILGKFSHQHVTTNAIIYIAGSRNEQPV